MQELKQFDDETILKILKLNTVMYPPEVKIFIIKTKQYLEIKECIKVIENKTQGWIYHLEALLGWSKELPKQVSNTHDNNEQLIKRIMALHQQTVRDLNQQWEGREKEFKVSESRTKELKEEVKFLRGLFDKQKEEYGLILKEIDLLKKPQKEEKYTKKKKDEDGEFEG